MDDLFEQKNLIMESAAFRVYGESLVRTWLNRGWITRIKPGAGNTKVTYSRIELDTVKQLYNKGKLR